MDVAINFTVKWAVKDVQAFFTSCYGQNNRPEIEITPQGAVRCNGALLKGNEFCTRYSYNSADEFLQKRLKSEGFCGMLASADISGFEVHGPELEVQKLREELQFYLNELKGSNVPVVYWVKVDGAFFVPAKLSGTSVANAANSTVSVNVYWDIKDYLEFIKGVYDFQELTKQETEIRYYGFAMTGETAVCKEGYDSAQGFLTHLENVKEPFQAALRSATVSHIEVHGPASENEKLRGPLKDFKATFYSPIPGRAGSQQC